MKTTLINQRTVLLLSLAVAVLVFYLNRSASSESHVFVSQYVEYARFLTGEVDRPIISFPIWGYPLSIAAVGQGIWLKMLQLGLAYAILLIIWRAWFRNRSMSVLNLFAFLLFAWIWFSTASVFWPAVIGVPILWISFLIFGRAQAGSHTYHLYAVAGTVAGVAANFRSDLFLLAVFVFVSLAGIEFITKPRTLSSVAQNLRGVAIGIVALFLVLLPWGIFNELNGSGFRLTSTNGGGVAAISLGQLPGNAWGIVHRDTFLGEILEQNNAGHL